MDIFQYTKNNADIVKIANAYGLKTKQRCPFHNDDNASFSISQNKQIFKCFGCDKGGDVIDLVAELDNISKREACNRILGILGLHYQTDYKSQSIYLKKQKEKLKLMTLYEELLEGVLKSILWTNKVCFNYYGKDVYNKYLRLNLIQYDLDLIDEELWDMDKYNIEKYKQRLKELKVWMEQTNQKLLVLTN